MKKLILVLTVLLGFGLSACKKDEKKPDDGETPIVTEKFEDKNIKVYTRDAASGTREAFFEIIGHKAAAKDNSLLAASMSEVTGNGDMIAKIKADKYGIGYISLSSLETSGLKGLKVDGVAPTEANVLNGSYKVMRNFNYMVRADFLTPSENYLTDAFVAYMSSIEGLGAIAGEGGIVDTTGAKPWVEVVKTLSAEIQTQLEKDNSSITLKLGGSTSVEKVAIALGREFSKVAGNVVITNNHTGSGDAYKRTQGGDKDSANALHIGFLSREVNDTEPAVVGSYGKLATDAIVIVIHVDNKVIDNITIDMLTRIFLKGDNSVTVWKNAK